MRRGPVLLRSCLVAGATVAAGVTAALLAPAAGADPGSGGAAASQSGGSSGPGGLTAVAVQVTLSGNGAPSGGAGGAAAVRTVSKPSPCRWHTYNADGEAFASAKNDPHFRAVGYGAEALPPTEVVEQYRSVPGLWYLAQANDPDGAALSDPSLQGYGEQERECLRSLRDGATGGAGSEWLFVPEGQAPPPPPPPVLTAEELLEVAQEAMQVPGPVVDMNPTVQGYVGLPSWLWVEDTEDPADGFLPVEITATAGASSATVRAEPDVFAARSATGSTTCAAESARTAWSPGAGDAAGCTLTPRRSSATAPGGFPVRTTTSYTVSWDGVTAGVPVPGGALAPLTRTESFALDVAEVQSLVTRGR